MVPTVPNKQKPQFNVKQGHTQRQDRVCALNAAQVSFVYWVRLSNNNVLRELTARLVRKHVQSVKRVTTVQ